MSRMRAVLPECRPGVLLKSGSGDLVPAPPRHPFSAEVPWVGDGGGVADTRCWCFSRIDSSRSEAKQSPHYRSHAATKKGFETGMLRAITLHESTLKGYS